MEQRPKNQLSSRAEALKKMFIFGTKQAYMTLEFVARMEQESCKTPAKQRERAADCSKQIAAAINLLYRQLAERLNALKDYAETDPAFCDELNSTSIMLLVKISNDYCRRLRVKQAEFAL
jgi:hypothetical protein